MMKNVVQRSTCKKSSLLIRFRINEYENEIEKKNWSQWIKQTTTTNLAVNRTMNCAFRPFKPPIGFGVKEF